MKAVTKAVTATASTSSVVGGGYTIYHFSSAESVSPEEEQDSSFSELKVDEVTNKVLKDEEDNTSNETVEDTSEKKPEPQTVPNLKQQQVDNRPKAPVKKLTENEIYQEAIKGLITFSTEDLGKDAYKDKILGITKKIHLPFLVKANEEANKKWWDWSYNKKFSTLKNSTTLYSLFSSVKKPYSDSKDDNEALNQACDKAYNEDKSKYIFQPENYLLENISFFCTKDKNKRDISEPETNVFGASYESSSSLKEGLLGVNTNKDILVNVRNDSNENEFWWNWSYHKKLKGKNDLTSYFTNVTSGFDENLNAGLNKACNEIYKKNLKDIRNDKDRFKLIKEIKSFCAINTKQDLVLIFENEPVSPETFSLIGEKTLDSNYKDKTLDITKQKNLDKIVKDIDDNEAWWEWSYQYNYLPNKTKLKPRSHFKNLTSGYYKHNKNLTLSKACNDAYLKDEDDYDDLIDDISLFCTIGKGFVDVTEPKSIVFGKDGYVARYHSKNQKQGLLDVTANKSNLSRATIRNDLDYLVTLWWNWSFKERFLKTKKEDLSDLFKPVVIPYSSDGNTALSSACSKAYEINRNTLKDDFKTLGDIQKFCTEDSSIKLVL